jgi:hypothetical protein
VKKSLLLTAVGHGASGNINNHSHLEIAVYYSYARPKELITCKIDEKIITFKITGTCCVLSHL